MHLNGNDLLLVTGATGLVGSHVVEHARQRGVRTKALIRPQADAAGLEILGVEICRGDMTDRASLKRGVAGATAVVHCAAKVGDWGPVDAYRAINVEGTRALLEEIHDAGSIRRLIHISSLGVYEARDHYGTDESEAPHTRGIDGYTLTKVEAEQVVREFVDRYGLPGVVLRPGFVYGPRDRAVLPKLLEKLKRNKVKFLGSGEQLMNNTFAGNLADAVFLAIESASAVGQTFNVTDGRLVSKREFMQSVAESAGYAVPRKSVPLPVARFLATAMEGTWRLLRRKHAPLLSSARIKFLGLNLDFCIDKARRELGYQPRVDFAEGMQQTVGWFRAQKRLP